MNPQDLKVGDRFEFINPDWYREVGDIWEWSEEGMIKIHQLDASTNPVGYKIDRDVELLINWIADNTQFIGNFSKSGNFETLYNLFNE